MSALVPDPVRNRALPLVLVVEDDAEVRRSIERALFESYRVATAVDGADGLAQAMLDPPDLVLTDMTMPMMSGGELILAIRRVPALAFVPIMILTGNDDHHLRVEALRNGAQDYLTKPFTLAELLARADNLVALKQTRDVLQGELQSRDGDVKALAAEITARKQELEGSLETARHARRDAEEAHERALRAVKARDEFLSIAAHELRTPLTPLQLQLDSIKRALEKVGSLDPSILSKLEKATRQTVRLAQLVESLLDASRVSDGQLRLDASEFDFRRLVGDVVRGFEDEAKKALVDMDVSGDSEVVGRWDKKRLEQVVSSLLSNAIKYGPGKPIHVVLEASNESVRLSVRDEGIGIEAAQIVRLFRRFERAVSSRNYGGLGLALYVAREIVEAHGGTIAASSEPGCGSTFTMDLPRWTQAQERPVVPADLSRR
jgi:signal transduction histidine kinase